MKKMFFCQVCKMAYIPVGPVTTVNRILEKDSYPCPTSLCQGRIQDVEMARTSTIMYVPFKNFYRAVHGFGLKGPEESPASLQEVSRHLTTKKVVGLVGRDTDFGGRSIIDQIVLDDGTRIHMADSYDGACVYYIETREEQDDANRKATMPRGGSTGKEDRRAHEDQQALESGPPMGAAGLNELHLPSLSEEGGVPGDRAAQQPSSDQRGSDQDVRVQGPVKPAD